MVTNRAGPKGPALFVTIFERALSFTGFAHTHLTAAL